MTIDELQLGPITRAAAEQLHREHPGVVFTSGARDGHGQARAMAKHVLQNRYWIIQTYTRRERPSYAVALALQAWVDGHPECQTVEALTEGLYGVLKARPDGWQISKHCWMRQGRPASGAFDLKPMEHADGTMTEEGQAVWNAILRLPGLDPPPLTREGGAHVWHAQFFEDGD